MLYKSYVEIKKGDKVVWKEKSFRFWLGGGDCEEYNRPKPSVGKDITGNGVPNLVISEFTGGWHCDYITHIFEIGPTFRKIASFNGVHSAVRFNDLDSDGQDEIILHDWTFAYWNMCFAASPAVKVILRYENGKYVYATDLMRRQPLSNKQLSDISDKIRQTWNIEEEKHMDLLSEMWGTMLNLIYSGNADQAYQLYYMTFLDDPNFASKVDMLDEFKQQLAKSPYWPAIKSMNIGKI